MRLTVQDSLPLHQVEDVTPVVTEEVAPGVVVNEPESLTEKSRGESIDSFSRFKVKENTVSELNGNGHKTSALDKGMDSIQSDSVTSLAGSLKSGIIMENPFKDYSKIPASEKDSMFDGGMSWIYLAFTVLFCVISVKFKGSKRYLKAIFGDLTDTRLRHNAFDDTVKETSLLVLFDILWIVCMGVMLWQSVKFGMETGIVSEIGLPFNPMPVSAPATGIGLCTAVVCTYSLIMLLSYTVVGNVFSDRRHTTLWVKGAMASSAMQSFLLFPIALLSLIYADWTKILLIMAAVVFLSGKIVFLYKGFRIFFAEISSWLLFLYYLCSLEIVPLLLTYIAALWACGMHG